jgi:hypothetical protein
VYGDAGLVAIADEPEDCVSVIESMLGPDSARAEWLAHVDDVLARMSWDETFRAMWKLVDDAVEHQYARPRPKPRNRVATIATSPSPGLALGSVPAAPSG